MSFPVGSTRSGQVVEFNFLKAQVQEPLSTFLEYITYEYMIENIMMLLKGTLSGRDVNELIEQCHPMVRYTRNRGERQTECRGGLRN